MAESLLSYITRPRVSKSSFVVSVLLVLCSCITSITMGYDGSMMNGLNILPNYTDYFHLTTFTLSFSASCIWIGGVLSGLTYGKVTDILGRRKALFWAAIITLFSAIIQSAAQNLAMFIVGRMLVGYGVSASGLTGPAYLAETLPFHWRAWGLGILDDFWYVGGLIAAAVTYQSSKLNSTWAWRIPSAMQGMFSILCIIILPFLPESPRWLIYVGRNEEALQVVAQTIANGDVNNALVLAQYKDIVDMMEHEKNSGEMLTLKEMVRTPIARKRMSLAVSVAVITTISGNVIASYYLGTMLDTAGIQNTNTQLLINIILNAWCLLCSLAGTYWCDEFGRKPTAIISTVLLTIFFFLLGILTKLFINNPHPTKSLTNSTIALIFLFQGAYSFGWTPLFFLYPPEILSYSIRANGMGVFMFVCNALSTLCIFCLPFVLDKIGWKTYIVNAAIDVLLLVWIWMYWVETKGKSLEEIDGVLGGRVIEGSLEGVRRELVREEVKGRKGGSEVRSNVEELGHNIK